MTMAQFSRDDMLIYQGWEKGREEGREEGIEIGHEDGIEAVILDNMENGISESEIVRKLRRFFSLDESTARRYFELYAR